jgi:hypothetical protein
MSEFSAAATPECRLTVLRDEVIPPGSGRGAYFPALGGGEEAPELHGVCQLDPCYVGTTRAGDCEARVPRQ